MRKAFEGSSIVFRVRDPLLRVSLPDAKGKLVAERRLLIGVVSPQGFYRAATPSQSDERESSKLYRVVVPKGQQYKVFLDTDLEIADELGARIERKKASEFIVAPGALDEVIVELGVR